MKSRLLGAVCACALGIITSANASLIFEIERISDTVANVTATGTLVLAETPVNGHQISFRDPFGIDPPENEYSWVFGSSTMLIGTVPVDFAYSLGMNWVSAGGVPWIYIGKIIGDHILTAGSSITGTLEWVLPASMTLAPVGSTGAVNWGHAADGIDTGTWNMVSAGVVPVPATVWLFGSGLIGLVVMARRRTA